jgi:hypothetical protein
MLTFASLWRYVIIDSSHNALGLYLGDGYFEIWLGLLLSLLRIFIHLLSSYLAAFSKDSLAIAIV